MKSGMASERCQSVHGICSALRRIRLPDAERPDRERHAREVIAPRFEKIVKRLAAKMSSAGEDMLELEIFSREIREQYPSDYMVPDGFKPVGVYLDAAAPRVMTDITGRIWPCPSVVLSAPPN